MKTRNALKRRIFYYYRQALGRFGEYIAYCHYWRSWHYIVARNWRCSIGEIDLITIQNRTLHLVEVKTRMTRPGPFSALSQMTEAKRQKLQDLSARYWNSTTVENRRMRILDMQIDFFGIDISWNGIRPTLQITHIPHIIAAASRSHVHFEEPKRISFDSSIAIF